MSLIAKRTGGSGFEPIAEGTHHAVCYGVVDMGTHLNPVWNKRHRQVLLMWEFPELRIDIERDGRTVNMPRVISRQLTLSLHDKAELRKILETWRGRHFTDVELDGFDVMTVCGANCMIQVMHNTSKEGRVFGNVSTVMPLPKSLPKLKAENPAFLFSLEDAAEIPPHFHEWIVDSITGSDEWKTRGMSVPVRQPGGDAQPPDNSDNEDDIPF